jgi:hypothetical protein
VLLGDLQRYCHLFMFHKHHLLIYRAGDGDRTRDVQLGKLAFRQREPFSLLAIENKKWLALVSFRRIVGHPLIANRLFCANSE